MQNSRTSPARNRFRAAFVEISDQEPGNEIKEECRNCATVMDIKTLYSSMPFFEIFSVRLND